MSLRGHLFRLNRWLGNITWNRRYIYLMIRDKPDGIEKFERNQLMKIRRLSGRLSNWLLDIRPRRRK